MSNVFRVDENIDCHEILAALEAHPELWTKDTFRQRYEGSAHSDTQTIYLRWAAENTAQSIQQSLSCVNREELDLLCVKRVVAECMSKIGMLSLGRIILVKLTSQGQIKTHIDEGLYSDIYERFHLVLQGTSTLTVGQRIVREQAGELWWLNHKEPHSAINEFSEDRIVMIIDGIAPLYRQER